MGAREFGLMVDHEMRERQIGASKLSRRIGELPDGTGIDASGIRLIREGRREKYTTELVRRIAAALGLDEDYCYWVAGVWPKDLDLEGYRKYRQLAAAHTNGVTARYLRSPAELPTDLDPDLIDGLRPHLADVVPLERRRRRSDRMPEPVAA